MCSELNDFPKLPDTMGNLCDLRHKTISLPRFRHYLRLSPCFRKEFEPLTKLHLILIRASLTELSSSAKRISVQDCGILHFARSSRKEASRWILSLRSSNKSSADCAARLCSHF
jgi:hypothetical protein